MNKVSKLMEEIVLDLVPQTQITEEDRAAIARHRDFLLGLEERLVQVFYDTLYAHPRTASVFVEGERPAREDTLRNWWRATVTGDLGPKYLTWMSLVGVIHIRRKVTNPMMLGMFHVIGDAVHAAALDSLDPVEAEQLRIAFSHVSATVSAVISESYTKGYLRALQDLAGLEPALVERMLQIELRQLEQEGRSAIS